MILKDGGLLEDLHEGMFQQPLWNKFLDKLRARTGAIFTALIFHTAEKDGVIRLNSGDESLAQRHHLFVEKHGWDPLVYRHMREGRVYAREELISPSDPTHRRLADEFLVPQGVSSIRSVRITEQSGVEAWLACAGGANIGSSTGSLLTALVPHVRIAMRNFVTLEREKFRSSVTSEAFGRLSFGWMTLDARCRIIDTTPYIEQLFQRTAILRRGRYGRLTPSSPAIDRELSAVVKSFAEGKGGEPGVWTLNRDPWMDMLVAPTSKRPIASARPVAIAYVSGDDRSQTERYAQLSELFGLLQSEAKMAWAIASGRSIAEAAREMNISIETARTYSKKIFAKTGARNQAGLVRIILTSVLAIM